MVACVPQDTWMWSEGKGHFVTHSNCIIVCLGVWNSFVLVMSANLFTNYWITQYNLFSSLVSVVVYVRTKESSLLPYLFWTACSSTVHLSLSTWKLYEFFKEQASCTCTIVPIHVHTELASIVCMFTLAKHVLVHWVYVWVPFTCACTCTCVH